MSGETKLACCVVQCREDKSPHHWSINRHVYYNNLRADRRRKNFAIFSHRSSGQGWSLTDSTWFVDQSVPYRSLHTEHLNGQVYRSNRLKATGQISETILKSFYMAVSTLFRLFYLTEKLLAKKNKHDYHTKMTTFILWFH